jgi:hypothetical protein
LAIVVERNSTKEFTSQKIIYLWPYQHKITHTRSLYCVLRNVYTIGSNYAQFCNPFTYVQPLCSTTEKMSAFVFYQQPKSRGKLSHEKITALQSIFLTPDTQVGIRTEHTFDVLTFLDAQNFSQFMVK